jgi:hypothetical protein
LRVIFTFVWQEPNLFFKTGVPKMKILFNGKLKAMRCGLYVAADNSAEEFILDTEKTDLTKKQLQDIASANKWKLGKKDTLTEMLSAIEENVSNSSIPKMDEKPDSQKVKEIVEAGVEAGTSDEDMVVQIIQAGVIYKVANKLFEAALAAGGFRLSVKERKEKVRQILLDKEFEPKDSESLDAIVKSLSEELPDTTQEQALKAVRAYCREFEFELPKAPSKPKGGFKSVIFAWIKENPTATTEDLKEFIVDEKEKDEKYVDKYSDILTLVRETVESLYEDEDEDEVVES